MTDASERRQKVRHIPHEGPRVETGAVQFGNDWPGVFIRGDNAFAIAMAIRTVEEVGSASPEAYFAMAELIGLRKCIEGDVIVRPPAGRDAE